VTEHADRAPYHELRDLFFAARPEEIQGRLKAGLKICLPCGISIHVLISPLQEMFAHDRSSHIMADRPDLSPPEYGPTELRISSMAQHRFAIGLPLLEAHGLSWRQDTGTDRLVVEFVSRDHGVVGTPTRDRWIFLAKQAGTTELNFHANKVSANAATPPAPLSFQVIVTKSPGG
jgi:hypothetical protein